MLDEGWVLCECVASSSEAELGVAPSAGKHVVGELKTRARSKKQLKVGWAGRFPGRRRGHHRLGGGAGFYFTMF